MAENLALRVAATLDAWRESGADAIDPVRFRTLEALARRAEGYTGEARRVVDDRLAALIDAYAAVVQRAAGKIGPASESQPSCSKQDDGLAGLLRHLRTHARPDGGEDGNGGDTVARLGAYFRDAWVQVRARRELRHSVERVPENAGPLNSNHLVQRSLSLMGEVSPGYLQQFLSYVDALSSLDRLQSPASIAGKEPPQTSGAKKTPRARRPKDGGQPAT